MLEEESSLKRVEHTELLLKERREKMNGRMMRKCSIIKDLLFSNKNRIAVEEELAQFNNLLITDFSIRMFQKFDRLKQPQIP